MKHPVSQYEENEDFFYLQPKTYLICLIIALLEIFEKGGDKQTKKKDESKAVEVISDSGKFIPSHSELMWLYFSLGLP